MSFPFQTMMMNRTSLHRVVTFKSLHGDVGLKAYYKYDEASGDLINLSQAAADLGSAADGQNSGAARGQTGLIDDAYQWDDGTSDKVVMGTSKSQWKFMSNTSMLFTLVFWFKQNNTTSGQEAIFMENDFSPVTLQGIGIEFRDTRRLAILIGNNALNFASANNFMPSSAGAYHMMMVSGDQSLGTEMAFSLDDGTPVTTGLTGTLADTDATNVMEMGNSGGAFPLEYDGLLDEMSVWNKILTAAEITSLFNSGNGLAIY